MAGPNIGNSTDRFNGAVTSLAIKVACVAAAETNQALSGALPTIDGVVIAEGDRVLLTAQTAPVENGIWCATAGANGWVRAPDWDGNRDIKIGSLVLAARGAGVDRLWQVTAPAGDILVGSTAVTITELPLGGGTPIVLLDNEELQFGTGTDVRYLYDGTDMLIIAAAQTRIRYQGGFSFSIEEQAAAPADNAGEGQVWVRDDAPNNLMYTDDDGTDFVIGGALAAGYHRLTATSRIVGIDAGTSQTGDTVIITGTGAGTNNTADNVIIIGHGSAPDFGAGVLTSIDGSIFIGNEVAPNQNQNNANVDPNILIGFQAGQLLDSTNVGENTIIGYRAMAGFETLTGASFSQNVFVGHQAAMNVGANTVSNSVCIGFQAGRGDAFTSGSLSGDIYIGARAGLNNRNGGSNTAVGTDAMGGAVISGAASNVAIGASALNIITSGDANIVLGVLAGGGIATQGDNIIVGDGAAAGLAGEQNTIIASKGGLLTTGDRNIMMGYRAGATSGAPHFPIDTSHNFVIESAAGSGLTRKTFLYGRTDTGNLVIGQGAGTGGISAAGDRGWGAGAPENVVKILNSPTVPTAVATNGATIWSVAGQLQLFGGLQTNSGGFSIAGGGSFFLTDGGLIIINDAGAADQVTLGHDGTDLNLAETLGATVAFNIRDGMALRVMESADADYVEILHNGTQGSIGSNTGGGNMVFYSTSGEISIVRQAVEVLRSYSLGIEIMSPTSNDPVLGFFQDDGIARNGFLQFSDTAGLVYWRSEIDSALVQIQGANSTSTNRVLATLDPDGRSQLNHGATDAIGIRTASTADDDITSTGQVVDGNGALRNIGFNELTRQNETGAYTFSKADAGSLIYKGASASNTYTTPASTATDIPAGAMWEVINNSGNTQSIAAGSGTTLQWMDAAGGGTGTRTLADGSHCWVWKFDDTTYFIWGDGLT